jgi:hypothetical protein
VEHAGAQADIPEFRVVALRESHDPVVRTVADHDLVADLDDTRSGSAAKPVRTRRDPDAYRP